MLFEPHLVAQVEVERTVRVATSLRASVKCYPEITLIISVWYGNDCWPTAETSVGILLLESTFVAESRVVIYIIGSAGSATQDITTTAYGCDA